MVCRHVNYLIKICLVIKMTLTRNVNIIYIHELFNFTTKNDKNIDSSKEGSDCDGSKFRRDQIDMFV